MQLFSVYDPGPNELVLPSEILLASLNLTPADDPGLAPAAVWMGCQPNPFAGSGLIRVGTKDAGPAKVTVYNLKGQKVREFHSGILPAGGTEFTWDGLDERGISCSQGVYLVRFKAQGCPSVVRRITLLKS
ncbi:MAG: FlgD immunoglobulin-like domain containing protein [Candidatus Syntrophosphaera sp.]